MSGPDAQAATQPWTRLDRWALVLLVLGVLASSFYLVHPWYDPENDGSIYIATARSMVAGEGYRFLGEAFHVRPPGFPFLLAPLIAAFGTDFQVLNTFVNLFGVLAVVLVFVLFRPTLGGVLSFLVAACLWLNPAFRTFSNQVMSDVPGTALVLACLVLERWARRRSSWQAELLLGLTLGLSAYVRTIVLLLVPAIVVARLWQRRRGELDPSAARVRFFALRLLLFAATTLAVQLPWSVRQASIEPTVPADQTFVFSYSTGMFHEDVGDPASRRLGLGEVAGRAFRRRFTQIAGTFGQRLLSLEATPFAVGFALFALAAILWRAKRRREPTDLAALAMIGVLSVYFGYQERLFVPVYVLALPAAAELLRTLLQRFLPESWGDGVLAAALLALLWIDLDPRRDWGVVRKRHNDFLELALQLKRSLPPDARLAAGAGFHYQVYLDRPVFSLSFAQRRHGAAGIEELIERRRIDHVILWSRFKQDRQLQEHLMQRYPDAKRVGPAHVLRVRR